MTHLFCQPYKPDTGSGFKKIYRSRRTTADLHKINAAAMVTLDGDRDKIIDARVVLGSWDARPHRYRGAEALLIGNAPNFDLFEAAAEAVTAGLAPVTDLEWVEKTRLAQARVLLRDTIAQAASRAKSTPRIPLKTPPRCWRTHNEDACHFHRSMAVHAAR